MFIFYMDIITFLNEPTPASYVYFRSYQTNNTIFITNQCEKFNVRPVYGAGIQTHNLLYMSRLP